MDFKFPVLSPPLPNLVFCSVSTRRGQSRSCAGSHLLLGAKRWCFASLRPMQGRQILRGGVRVLRTSDPRAEFSSYSPRPRVPPEPPPSVFPEQVARSWAAQAQLTWRMLMVVCRDLFSSRKRDGPSGPLLSLFLTKALLIVFGFLPPFPTPPFPSAGAFVAAHEALVGRLL